MEDVNAARERDRLRDQFLAESPGNDRPLLHLWRTLGIGLAACTLALAMLHQVLWVEFCIVPVTLQLANIVEWVIHKHLMHRPRPGVRIVYVHHALRHHVLYEAHAMAVRDRREWKFVLLSTGEFLGLLGIATIFSLLGAAVFTANVGWLMLFTMSGYVLFYEVSHLACHLQDDHPIRRIPGLVRATEHHRDHHDKGLMGKWNFNIFAPVTDRFFGTLASKELIARRQVPPRGP
jgi:hypothetical protein